MKGKAVADKTIDHVWKEKQAAIAREKQQAKEQRQIQDLIDSKTAQHLQKLSKFD